MPVLSVAVMMLLNSAFEENLVYAGGQTTKESGIFPELPEMMV